DGDPWTYWSAPSQAPPPVLTVDVGAEEEIAGVYLALGERPGDAFHHLRVEASRDGSAWQLVKEARWDFPVTFRSNGQVSILPDDVQMVLFAPQRARWVRLVLLEAFPERNWSVGELAIFGTRPDAGESSLPLELPVFSDPTSSDVLERRLRLEVDRE